MVFGGEAAISGPDVRRMSGKAATSKVIKFNAKLDKFSPESGWHFIPVTKAVADSLKFTAKGRRVVCTLNGTERLQCALMPYQGAYFMMINKGVRTRLGIEPGDTVAVELVRDDSTYGLEMSEEFREVLNQDPDGDRMFHELTPGKQRSLIYYVGKFKDLDRRIHTALIILDHLKQNEGKIVAEKLHEELKRPAF